MTETGIPRSQQVLPVSPSARPNALERGQENQFNLQMQMEEELRQVNRYSQGYLDQVFEIKRRYRNLGLNIF